LSACSRKLRELLNFCWLFHSKKNPISLNYITHEVLACFNLAERWTGKSYNRFPIQD
jgi:hypothetical protein